MGMFDSVFVNCKKCGKDVEFQSKAGECCLRKYRIDAVPAEIAIDLAGGTACCRACGEIHTLALSLSTPRYLPMLVT